MTRWYNSVLLLLWNASLSASADQTHCAVFHSCSIMKGLFQATSRGYMLTKSIQSNYMLISKNIQKKSKSLGQYVSPASTLAWGHVWVPLQGHISSSLVTETNFGHWCWCQSQKHSSTCSYKTEAENQQIHDLLCCAEYLSSINTGRLLHRN